MNVKTIALFCAVSLLVCALLQAKEPEKTPAPAKTIPGGIVATKGKEIRYYDFATKKLTKLGEADVFAITEDGTKMLQASEGNGLQLQIVTLPSTCQTLQISRWSQGSKPQLITGSYMLPMNTAVENLTLSPLGDKFSFERSRNGQSLVRFVPRNIIPSKQYANAPWFAYQDDAFHTVHFGKITTGFAIAEENDLGNSAFFPPVSPYKLWGTTPPPH